MSSQHRTDQNPLGTPSHADPTTATGVDPTARGEATPATAGGACGCVSRRQSFVVAGAAVAGTAGLTACAASSAASELIKAAEVPVGGGKVFEDLKVVVTQPTAGDYKAFSATCPHQGCSVTTVKDNVITCPCHGSQFDATTGDVTKGPATRGLDAKSVSVGADGLTIS